MKTKYIIYARKSSEGKDRQALSIESQLGELSEYAKSHKLEVVDILEESQSAFKKGRPIFAKMLEKIESGQANAVLVWKPDRLARNAVDGGRIIQAMDDGQLIEIVTPYGETFRNTDSRMMLHVHFGMSSEYSRQISSNVKRGNRQKYKRGEYPGAAPIGFINMRSGNSRNISPDPSKAPLIRKLFELCATGQYSVADLSRVADELGLRTRNGNKVAKSGMHDLLKRTTYFGLFKHGGQMHEGSYEPIVSKELFDRSLAQLVKKQKPHKDRWSHHFKGLLYCGECGCSITAETKKKHYRGTDRDAFYTYYRCTHRRGGCSQKPVTSQEMDQLLGDLLNDVCIDQATWNLGIELLKQKHLTETQLQEKIRLGWQQDFQRVQKKLDSLLNMRLDGELGAEEYATKKDILLNEKTKLHEKLEDNSASSLHWLELAENFFDTALAIRSVMEGGDNVAKKDLLLIVGSNFKLEDKKVTFTLEKPYDLLVQPKMRSDLQGY